MARYVRRNSIEQPKQYTRNEFGRYVYAAIPGSKAYRMYSKWHVLHEPAPTVGTIISLCGTLQLHTSGIQIVDTLPVGTKSSNICSHCEMVQRAIARG